MTTTKHEPVAETVAGPGQDSGRTSRSNSPSTPESTAGEKSANTRWLGRLGDALQVVRASVAPDITVQRLLILLAARAHEGMSQKELLCHLDDCSITALSRNLADLSGLTSRKQPGPGLVELRQDPMNLRVRRVYLTGKGRALVDDLEAALAGQGADPA